MHGFLEKYLLGQLNLELLEIENKSKKWLMKLLSKELKEN